MCDCADDNVTDATSDLSTWTYVPFKPSGPAWRRIEMVPRQWYSKHFGIDTTCVIGCVLKERDAVKKSTCVGILTTLTEAQLDTTPMGALKTYMEVNCNAALPYFCEDGRAVVVLSDGSLTAVGISNNNLTTTTLSPKATLLADDHAVVRGAVTSCVDGDVTIVRIISEPTSLKPSASVSTLSASASTPPSVRWGAYNQYGRNAILEANADAYSGGNTRDTVTNGVVYHGVISMLPSTMHAVWLSSPKKALFVTQFGRAILIDEKVLATLPSTTTLNAVLQDAFVRFVSYDVPEMTSDAEYYKPIVPLPVTNMYDAVIISGRGEAALIRIQGAFRMVMVNVNVAVTRSALRRVRDELYIPGDVLIEYHTERLFLVCTFVVGTIVVRRLHPDTGKMSPPQRLNSRIVTKGVSDGRWSLLPPAVVDVCVCRNFVWLLAGNTRYRTRTGLLHEEGHTIKPCGSFSVTHVPDRIGSDDTTSWVSMSPEPGSVVGLPVVICTTPTSSAAVSPTLPEMTASSSAAPL